MSNPLPPDLTPENYVAVGIATCFVKVEGKLQACQVLEPIPSAALAAILQGSPTSYSHIQGVTLGALLTEGGVQWPEGAPSGIPWADQFAERAVAAARTYRRHTHLQELVPLGTVHTDLHFSVDRKRVLNAPRLVSEQDNVKQHTHTHERF
ncbi:MAG: hypothetical protein IGQ88_00185 [Gloeomargaritaceae cyanobacterium C42_A2020_066]|nr:hypothetical protein [Gloeomargaritaceae cyanobacterium C42_A2020_066]